MINNHDLTPENPSLNFPQSIDHNLAWVKKMAIEHDCSSVLAASAALMTMTMMDHHKLGLTIDQIRTELDVIKNTVETIRIELCQSSSLPDPSKESL